MLLAAAVWTTGVLCLDGRRRRGGGDEGAAGGRLPGGQEGRGAGARQQRLRRLFPRSVSYLHSFISFTLDPMAFFIVLFHLMAGGGSISFAAHAEISAGRRFLICLASRAIALFACFHFAVRFAS